MGSLSFETIQIMKKHNFFLLTLILIISFSCASSGLFGDKENETPLKTADTFYKMLMWKYYDRAAAFIDPEFLVSYEDFVSKNKDDLNITSYEIRELTPLNTNGKDKKEKIEEMKVKVILTFYRYPSVTEKTVETWNSWIKTNDRWFAKTDFSKDIFNTESQ